MTTKTDEQERAEFETWWEKEIKPKLSGYEFLTKAILEQGWMARAALAAQASGQEQDPFQPAANWLVNGCGYAAINVAQSLRIGFNRAERMTDAARAAAKGEA